jgi:hypothetical protein
MSVLYDRDGNRFPQPMLDERGVGGDRLPADLFARVWKLAHDGVDHMVAREWRAAFEAFRSAIALIPEPIEAWNASGWLLVGMADAAVEAGDFRAALPPIGHATTCPGTLGNPWVDFRLGQVRCMLGDLRGVDDIERAVAALAHEMEQFDYEVTRDKVFVKFRNRIVRTLVGKDADEVRAAIASGGDVQLLLARKTGNFKRGNERR